MLAQTLEMWWELDAMREQDTKAVKPEYPGETEPSEAPRDVSPLLQWLHKSAKPGVGLKALRRRLAKKLSGTMADTVREGRNDRV